MRVALLALVLIGHPAWADRAAAEKLANQAETAHDIGAFVACGQALLDVYNLHPEASDTDRILFDAASCFERGKSLAAALQADAILVKSFPSSRLAAPAILQSGKLFEQIVMYDRAAERFEEYATRYAGARDAVDVLADAIRLRAALGDSAKQISDTRLLSRTFGLNRPALAASTQLALLSVLDGDDAIALLRSYLKDHATVDAGQTIIAHVELADRLRAKSCSVHETDRLCVKLVVDRTPHCGTALTNVVAIKRTAANREALAEYRAAVALADGAKSPAARHAQAMARLALADDDLETLIASPMPRDLAFAHGDSKRFSGWMDTNLKLRKKLDGAYSVVLLQKDATSSVAAAARFGEVTQVMWRALMSAELPKDSRVQAEHDTYCEDLKQVGAPFHALALQEAWACLAKARELEAGQEWADVCWRDGALLDPEAFAPVRELRGTASELAPPIALEPPVTSPPPPVRE
jgi:tetratricopeptide (TPR) repeat protein